MCWTLKVSFAFGVSGLVLAVWFDKFWKHEQRRCGAIVLAYFAFMEFIQAAQHLVLEVDPDPITTCTRNDNKFLTAVAMAHLCFQPLMLHWHYYKSKQIPKEILKMVLVGCLMDATAMVYGNIYNPALALRDIDDNNNGNYYDWEACRGGQWAPGANLCTTSGIAHLAWSTPMPVPSYEYHGPLHSFVWFAPFLCGNMFFALEGLSLYLIGPVFSRWWVRSNGGSDQREVGSTWCFLQFGVFAVIFANNIVRIIFKRQWTSKSKQQKQK